MGFLFENKCKFNNCGENFDNLYQLIKHIEQDHINFMEDIENTTDLTVISMPLSKILPNDLSYVRMHDGTDEAMLSDFYESSLSNSTISTDSDRAVLQDVPEMFETSQSTAMDAEMRMNEFVGYCSSTEDETYADYIVDYAIKNADKNEFKPYPCPVAGCFKRYKNINGIKYHAIHGHINYSHKAKKPKLEYTKVVEPKEQKIVVPQFEYKPTEIINQSNDVVVTAITNPNPRTANLFPKTPRITFTRLGGDTDDIIDVENI